MFQHSLYTANWHILLWFWKICNLNSNAKTILDSFKCTKNSQKVHCMFEWTHMQKHTDADHEDLQIRIINEILWIISSFHAYKLFYSADSFDNNRSICNVPDSFLDLLYRGSREEKLMLLLSQGRRQDVLLCSLNLAFSLCVQSTSRSICKTIFINTSRVIRKQEHTFGIPARWV